MFEEDNTTEASVSTPQATATELTNAPFSSKSPLKDSLSKLLVRLDTTTRAMGKALFDSDEDTLIIRPTGNTKQHTGARAPTPEDLVRMIRWLDGMNVFTEGFEAACYMCEPTK